ncbi:phospholipid metabolism-related protein [Naematelia encephala]|uniref:Phospholipid metabolism-related protein n=1 Tax=Naematelia encephala TaxID=71784 RepID=A0A1Y2B492_9TREE|nr:phospholipid metabolism-related protein [Naematelia encephala]
MTSFADTVRFCFPAPRPPPSTLPLHGLSSNGAASHSRNDALEPDLSEGVAKATVGNVLRAYAPDWILAAVLWGVLAILNRSPGHKREFSLNDISIQHTFAEHERVPPTLLGIISAGIPLLVLLPISILVARNPWDVHNSVIGLFMSYTMTGVVTQIVKMMVGRPRPDLINRCMPAPGATDAPVFGLSTYEICTSTNQARLDDGFKSFPSGHSSLSFAGLGFLSLYLAGKMHLWDKRGHRNRAWFALSPLLGAAMVAISRTEDNRHHWQDVLVGSILGLAIAGVTYRCYFPPLSHRQCHLPLAPHTASPEELFDPDASVEDGRVQLLSEENDRAARPSEEEVVWSSQVA